MKKLILLLLIPTLISCSLVKKIKRNKAKEETKEIALSKLDSINETKIEEEIISTFVSDSTAETIDLSTETTTILFNDSGEVKSIVTTKKTNIKSNQFTHVGKKANSNTKAEIKTDLSKNDKSEKSKVIEVKNVQKEVKRDSTKSWFWIILGISFVGFIFWIIWRFKKRNVTL